MPNTSESFLDTVLGNAEVEPPGGPESTTDRLLVPSLIDGHAHARAGLQQPPCSGWWYRNWSTLTFAPLADWVTSLFVAGAIPEPGLM